MSISRILHTKAAALFFTTLSLGVANAGTLSTPILFTGGVNQLICIANNVSNQPITVTVRMIGLTGTSIETCTLPAGDNQGCQEFRNNDAAHCTITAGVEQSELRARVRGVMFSRRTTSAPFTIEAVVQAE